MRCFLRSGTLYSCLAVSSMAVLATLLPLRTSLHAEGQVQPMGVADKWWYEGEVESRPIDAASCFDIPCRRVCDWRYCANGTGRYDTDGGESYKGEFSHGWMHGHGEYSSDFVEYIGSFKNGAFDGDGALTCPQSETVTVYVEGRFTEGFMDGPFKVNGQVKVFSHIPVGPVLPGFITGPDYAAIACPHL